MGVASIQALLSAPNPDDPLAENIAKHWKTNEQEAVETGEFFSKPIYIGLNIDYVVCAELVILIHFIACFLDWYKWRGSCQADTR